MLMLVGFLVLVLFIGTPAYFYGVFVGREAGLRLGRAGADREWALMLENGMVGPGSTGSMPGAESLHIGGGAG